MTLQTDSNAVNQYLGGLTIKVSICKLFVIISVHFMTLRGGQVTAANGSDAKRTASVWAEKRIRLRGFD